MMYISIKPCRRGDKIINIYLDDLRDCPKGYEIARNVERAKQLFKSKQVNILSLDHDLGEDLEGDLLETGYDFVKYFCENALYCKKIYIHTDNVVGRTNMYETLQGAQRRGFISNEIKIYHYSINQDKYSGN